MNTVTLDEVIPTVLQLTTMDKVRLIRILAEQIEQPKQEAESMLDPGKIYYLHTPTFADGTASQLMQLLEQSPPEN